LTGYQANQAARSLASGRSGSVGFLLSEPQQLLFSDPNFAVLLREATRVLAEHDIPLLLMLASTQQERRRIARYIDAGHVDGVLLISPHRSDPLLRMLVDRRLPAVCCGKPLGMEGRMPYVAADDYQGGADMTTHLLGLGYQRIAMIAGPEDMSGGVERLAGYRAVLGESADPRLVALGDYSRQSGARAMAELLDRDIPIDAVFAASDLMAAGAMDLLHERDVSIPGDIAVTGFDDTGLAATLKPALTTMHQPFDRIANEMVRLLLAAIDEAEPPSAILLPATLVRRLSD
jgi:DNA-binding LacI/PurR family transcriptional regulator